MWTLLIVTVLSTEPAKVVYNPYATVNTKEECERLAEIVKKNDTEKTLQVSCVRNRRAL
jgi:hypothetical protein